VTDPVPHWPGRLVSLADGQQVYVAETVLARGTTPGTPALGSSAPPRTPSDAPRDRVLCVHGMSGAATNWTDFLAELVPDFDGAAVDLPGSGHSPPPKSPGGYSIKALARTVTRLIEALGEGPVHLVGNSMGGAVCIRAAASRPDLVRTLTLISPVLPDRVARPLAFEFSLAALPVLGTLMMRRAERLPPENRVAGVIATCFFDPAAVHPERFALEVAEVRRQDELGYAPVTLSRAAWTIVLEYLRPRRFSLWRAAERIPVPALVVFGSDDKLVNPRLAAPAARAFRDADVAVLPRTGHVAQMEHPGLVAARFRAVAGGMRGEAPRLTPDEVPSS
jgi:pimeloyl-ACP methyl ester carboxylesterase